MSQYILDCNYTSGISCTLTPYTPPPATVDHYTLGPDWMYLVVGVLLLVFIVATAIVRHTAHTERGTTERQRILHPPRQCPTCGDVLMS